MRTLGLVVMLIAILGGARAAAHETKSGYLEIRETAAGSYDVVWRLPARSPNDVAPLELRFAEDVEIVGEPVSGYESGSVLERMRITRPGGLTDTEITIVFTSIQRLSTSRSRPRTKRRWSIPRRMCSTPRTK